MSYDAIIIGGGPAGSTLGNLLSTAGLRVALIEKVKFPRHHIGESLLPATNEIFKELGVYELLRKKFIAKPGGKWFVGSKSWVGDFSVNRKDCTFRNNTEALMVDRSEFDQILLKKAEQQGCQVFQPAKIEKFEKNDETTNLQIKTSSKIYQLRSNMLFDCSGESRFLTKKLKIESQPTHSTNCFYSYFQAEVIDRHLSSGWFVGQMFKNSWAWAIPLDANLFQWESLVILIVLYQKILNPT